MNPANAAISFSSFANPKAIHIANNTGIIPKTVAVIVLIKVKTYTTTEFCKKGNAA